MMLPLALLLLHSRRAGTAVKLQSRTLPNLALLFIQLPPGDVYGTYVPYTGPLPQVGRAKYKLHGLQHAERAARRRRATRRARPPHASNVADATSLPCNTVLWVADKVYGPYVPYRDLR